MLAARTPSFAAAARASARGRGGGPLDGHRSLDRGARGGRHLRGRGGGRGCFGPEPDRRRGVLSTHLHSEGKFAEKLMVEAPSSRSVRAVTEEMLEDPAAASGPAWRAATSSSTPSPFPRGDPRGALGERLHARRPGPPDPPPGEPPASARSSPWGSSCPRRRSSTTSSATGNTTAASIPIALSEAIEAGRVRPGALVLPRGLRRRLHVGGRADALVSGKWDPAMAVAPGHPADEPARDAS